MNDEELLRYSRQIMLPEIEIEGQQRLLDATALIIGLGGLGCPVAMYLAAAGVGHLVLADFDKVELSNLQRQIAHTTDRVGMNKADSAGETATSLNPGVKLTCIRETMDNEQLRNEIGRADIVLDCTDNFAIRFDVNELCVATRTPLVSGAAIRLEGQVMVYDPNLESSPCYRCLYQDAIDGALNCAETGVAAPVVGVVGSIQAMEAIKLLSGFGESLAGYVLVFDAKYMQWQKLTLSKNPRCSACGSAGVPSL